VSVADLDVLEAAARLRDGGLTAADLLRAARERIADLDGDLGCYRWLELAAPPAGPPGPSPLWGIPYGIKANLWARGAPADCASRLLAGWVPPADAAAVARLRAAGAVLLGTLNLDEFAMGSSTEHAWGLATRNPWHPDHVPGGSSGGAAAAVAAGLAGFALGSDTGGSVRQPAHCCGVTGLIAGYGRVSRRGLVPHATSLDRVGVLTRSVADAAAVLAHVAGRDAGDATSTDLAEPDPVAATRRVCRGLRVGWVRGLERWADADTLADQARCRSILADAGAVLDPVDLPDTDLALAAYTILASAEAGADLARYDGGHLGPRAFGGDHAVAAAAARTAGFGAEVRLRLLTAAHVLRAGHADRWAGRAARARALIHRELRDLLHDRHVLLLPTAAGPAFRRGERTGDPVAMRDADRFTVPASLAGLPAMTVPTTLTAAGLPLSAQLIGRDDGEGALLTLGAALERGVDFDARRKEAPWRRR